MKRIMTFVFMFALIFSFSGIVKADTVDCSIVNCGSNGSPENVSNTWGGTNSSVPHVQPGEITYDEGGVPMPCPTWFTNYCVDISGTQYYKDSMLVLGHQLKLLGVTGGIFGYWINLAQ